MEFGVKGGVRDPKDREEKRIEDHTVTVPVCNQLKPKSRKRDDRNHSMAIEVDLAEGG